MHSCYTDENKAQSCKSNFTSLYDQALDIRIFSIFEEIWILIEIGEEISKESLDVHKCISIKWSEMNCANCSYETLPTNLHLELKFNNMAFQSKEGPRPGGGGAPCVGNSQVEQVWICSGSPPVGRGFEGFHVGRGIPGDLCLTNGIICIGYMGWTEWQTHKTGNITFPQLRWRALTISSF